MGPFSPGEKICADHDHISAKYNGPAHNSCNLNYKISFNIPVVFHNLSNYDAYFILNDVANCFEGDIKVIPATLEKYIAFIKYVNNTKIRYTFNDSFRFLNFIS